MAEVIWTEQALDDLGSILSFIVRDSSDYAALTALRIIGATDMLSAFPESGRIVPEIGREDLREIIVQNFRVIYRVGEERIEVLTVHHGARSFEGIEPPI